VWGGGILQSNGVLDFAGGIVVHTTAGFAALAAVFYVGKRRVPDAGLHSIPLVALGTGLLWFGWYGFNAGSELQVDAVTGQAFLNTLNPANAQGIMVPDAWSGTTQNALSHVMVQDYIAKFGGTSSDINADVAEAYSAGEVLADAVTGTHSVNNAKIISYLHTLHKSLQTVQGPVKFTSIGANHAQTGFIYQWQNGQFLQVLPTHPIGSLPIELTKPAWQGN